MLSDIRHISILNKIFNLNESEWPKIIISWVLRFFHRAGFVIGWTVLVAMFTSRFGIASLPYLFAVNALFTIAGSFIYSAFLDRVSKTWLMVATVFLAGIILLLAIQIAGLNQMLFFILLLVVTSIFAVQLRLFFDGYIGELFTPLECERTFPLIDAAETLGGMTAAVTIVTFSHSIDVYKLVYVWVICLFLIIPFIFIFESLNKKVVIIEELENEAEVEDVNRKHGMIALVKEELKNAKTFSFLKGLFVLVFLQWLLFDLLEFQYTKAVYNSVSGAILEGGSGFEGAFAYELGVLFLIFSISTLVVQLFVGGRLINALGVIGTMIVHPIMAIISLLGLILSFNFYLAVLAKNNFALTTAVFNNVFLISTYALKEKVSDHGWQFIDGVVRPIGALTGTLVIIVLGLILTSRGMVFAVNILMIIFAGIFLYVTIRQRGNYTKTALKNLNPMEEKKVRMNAVDVLSQRGHVDSLPVLIKFLHKKDESVALRVRILRAFAEIQEEGAIKDIIKCFTSDKAAIREAAVDALLKYKVLSQPSNKFAVVKYELVGALKKMYEEETHEDIRSRIITLLSKLSNVSTLEFLLNILHKAHGNLKADAIYALGNYGDADVIEFIRPYLKSNRKEKINAAIALGRFPDHLVEATYVISSFVFSKVKEEIAYGLYAIGELNLKKFKRVCLQHLHSKNLQLKMYGALALAKMGYHEAVPALVDMLFHEDREVAKCVKNMIKNVDVRIYKNIDKIVRHVVDKEIQKLIKKNKVTHWSDLQKEHLVTLKWLYYLVEEYDEMELIDNLI